MRLSSSAWAVGLSVALAGIVAISPAQGALTEHSSAGPAPRTASFPTVVPVVFATIPVGREPTGIAISDDDTVYVVNSRDNSVSVINPGSLEQDDTIAVGQAPIAVAIGGDSTVYVSNSADDSISVIAAGSSVQTSAIALNTDDTPYGVALSQSDDTLYVVAQGSNRLVAVDVMNPSVLTYVGVGAAPTGVAVTDDDTVYVTNSGDDSISIISDLAVQSTAAVGHLPRGITIAADDSVYVANSGSGTLSLLTGAPLAEVIERGIGSTPISSAFKDGSLYVTLLGDDSVAILPPDLAPAQETFVAVGNYPTGIAVARGDSAAGVVYVTNANYFGSDGTVSLIDDAEPALREPSGSPGDPVHVDVSLDCDGCFLMDDSTVTSIAFGGTPVTGWSNTGFNSMSGPVPAGSGTVEVTVTFNGGNTASAGFFTYAYVPPAPAPPWPPAPAMTPGSQALSGVTGVPVTPTTAFTLANFTQSPGFSVAPTLPLGLVIDPVTGVISGTPMVAQPPTQHRVTASAGGGAESATSTVLVTINDAPTPPPVPTALITGSRTDVRGRAGISITGATTEVEAGSILRPMLRFPGRSAFTEGTARILVGTDGRFAWQRTTGRKTYVYVQSQDGTLKSNRVTIPAD
jgi:YVTN family beta-propeller protein